MKQLFLLVSVTFFASACGHTGDPVKGKVSDQSSLAAADSEENQTRSTSYATAHAAAVIAIERAAARGHAWSTSGQLLTEAAAAAADGDDALAIRLADKARIQAELAVEQANFEASAWVERVLTN